MKNQYELIKLKNVISFIKQKKIYNRKNSFYHIISNYKLNKDLIDVFLVLSKIEDNIIFREEYDDMLIFNCNIYDTVYATNKAKDIKNLHYILDKCDKIKHFNLYINFTHKTTFIRKNSKVLGLYEDGKGFKFEYGNRDNEQEFIEEIVALLRKQK